MKVGVSLSCRLKASCRCVSSRFILSNCCASCSTSHTNGHNTTCISGLFTARAKLPFSDISATVVSFSSSDGTLQSYRGLGQGVSFARDRSFRVMPVTRDGSAAVILPLTTVVIFVVVDNCLLVCGVLCVSVSESARFCKRLGAVNAAGERVGQVIHSRVFEATIVNVPDNLVINNVISLKFIPFTVGVVCSNSASLKRVISFSPVVFTNTTVFAFFATVVNDVGPTGVTTDVSPITTSHCARTGAEDCQSRGDREAGLSQVTQSGVFEGPGDTFLAFTSLFLNLVLFLISTNLLSDLDPGGFMGR